MRRRALSFVAACLTAALVSLAVLVAVLPPLRGSLRQALLATEVVGLGMAVTYPLLFLPVFVALGRRARRPRRVSVALVGALLSLVTFLWTAWALEGFEYGLGSLMRDPASWAWLLALTMGGAAFGLVWRATSLHQSPTPPTRSSRASRPTYGARVRKPTVRKGESPPSSPAITVTPDTRLPAAS